MKKIFAIILALSIMFTCLVGCDFEVDGSYADTQTTLQNASDLQSNQPTPTDIEYSLERYNLIRRAYWVNGQREKSEYSTLRD